MRTDQVSGHLMGMGCLDRHPQVANPPADTPQSKQPLPKCMLGIHSPTQVHARYNPPPPREQNDTRQ